MVTYISVVISIIIAIVFWIKKKKKEKVQMPQGLQIFNEQGIQILDITDNLTRYGGRIVLNAASGQMTLPAVTDRIWIFPTIQKGYLNYNTYDSDNGKGSLSKLKISLNRKMLSWRYLNSDRYVNALPVGRAVVYWGEY